MIFNRKVFLLLFCLVSASGFASEVNSQAAPEPIQQTAAVQTASFEQLFKNGIQAYQDKKYDEAREAFSKALDQDPRNVSALTNLGLTQFQLGKKGYAVALLRKAVGLDPGLSTPNLALKFILPQLEVKEIPHEIQYWENLRSQFLAPVSLTIYLTLTAILLFASGWIWLGYLGARRRSLNTNDLLPPFPGVGLLLAVGFLFCLGMSGFKIYDFQIPRATVLADKVIVLSAPDEKAASLFDLYSGLEVIILSADKDWAQITYPGALSGWVPKAAILHTSGKAPW